MDQLNIFDYLNTNKQSFDPGEWVEEDTLGKELTFDEIAARIGKLIIIDMSTISHAWYKVVKVERICYPCEGSRRLVYYDGVHQRGLVDEMYFDKRYNARPVKAWDLK